MASHVSVLTPVDGAATITPRSTCGYLYERFDGDPAALQLDASSADIGPADPSWPQPPSPFPGCILENVNMASSQTVIAYDAHFKINGGTVAVPARSFVHIWLISLGGALTEAARQTGSIPEAASAAWIGARVGTPAQKASQSKIAEVVPL